MFGNIEVERKKKYSLADFLWNLKLVKCVGFKSAVIVLFTLCFGFFWLVVFHSILYQSCSLSSLLQEVLNH